MTRVESTQSFEFDKFFLNSLLKLSKLNRSDPFPKPAREDREEKNFLNHGLSVDSREVKSWKEERFRVQPDRSLIFQRDILHDNGSPVYRYPDESFLRISAQNRVVASVAASFHSTLSVVERNMRAIPLEKPSPRNRRVSRRFLRARNILLNKGGGLITSGGINCSNQEE